MRCGATTAHRVWLDVEATAVLSWCGYRLIRTTNLMTFFSILAAFALEQVWPLGWRNPIFRLFGRYANFLQRALNAGEYRHGILAWFIAIVPFVAFALGVYYSAGALTVVLAWVVNVVVLYLTMGFRQFSHAFTGINEALELGDLNEARRLLEDWIRQPCSEMSVEEISRLAIEQGVIDSFRHVFAVLFWFAILPGPSGAVIYRMAALLDKRWGRRHRNFNEAFGGFASQMQRLLDWVPQRLTAVSFAIVGNFEDAMFCWRSQASTWVQDRYGILLSSAAGALGIRLGESLHRDHTVVFRPELGVGDVVEPQHLQSAVGLLWRTVVFWMLIIMMISAALLL